MKTFYTVVIASMVAVLFANNASAQRYCSEIFQNVCVTPDITYATNISILTGTPTATDLKMDIYAPCSDTAMHRPLLIYMHTGSFLPVLFNGSPTGSRNDSASVEMCKRFARRGYVVANMDYRMGWIPTSTDQDTRTGTLLLAVYRAIQDAKSCVRYFKKDYATQGNTYKIDSGRIALVGQGTGGYIALAYATLNHTSEIQLLKFVSGTDNTQLGFQSGYPYVNQTLWGDFDGLNGTAGYSMDNTPGYSGHIRMVVNMGGALGDSSWLEHGDVPIVAFHPVNDPFAPYTHGVVIVPGFGYPVVEVFGSHDVMQESYAKGNQTVFSAIASNCDPYTTRANQVNGGMDGLFPFVLPDPGAPYHGQVGPWEWVSLQQSEQLGAAFGMTQGHVDSIYAGALLTNPNIGSKAHAMAYIDTIMGYASPRLSLVMGLGGCAPCTATGIAELPNGMNVTAYPNPVGDVAYVNIDRPAIVRNATVTDVLGNAVTAYSNIEGQTVRINTSALSSGLYMVKVVTDRGTVVRRIVKD